MKLKKMIMYPAMLCAMLSLTGYLASAQNAANMNAIQNKTATISHVCFGSAMPDMQEIEARFSLLPSNQINIVNWPDRNGDYAPKASFKIMYSDTDLYIRYQVEETEIRSTFGQDLDSRPWTDDCMELFIAPVNETAVYYNIEMNCTGYGIVGFGQSKKDRGHFGPEQMSRIRRYSTLGREAFGSRISDSPISWSMIIVIPLDLICQGRPAESLRGQRVRGNVFKCGDDMIHRHYLTWNPVGTERPDYHRPEYFGFFKFE